MCSLHPSPTTTPLRRTRHWRSCTFCWRIPRPAWAALNLGVIHWRSILQTRHCSMSAFPSGCYFGSFPSSQKLQLCADRHPARSPAFQLRDALLSRTVSWMAGKNNVPPSQEVCRGTPVLNFFILRCKEFQALNFNLKTFGCRALSFVQVPPTRIFFW